MAEPWFCSCFMTFLFSWLWTHYLSPFKEVSVHSLVFCFLVSILWFVPVLYHFYLWSVTVPSGRLDKCINNLCRYFYLCNSYWHTLNMTTANEHIFQCLYNSLALLYVFFVNISQMGNFFYFLCNRFNILILHLDLLCNLSLQYVIAFVSSQS